LSYLKRFPIDHVKIDRSFIKDIPGDADDVSITKAIIAMAHNLRLAVIAEGVETVEQAELLRQLQCEEAQGYLFGKPMPADEFERKFLQPERAESINGVADIADVTSTTPGRSGMDADSRSSAFGR
jgi:EAL domain-containing protein (putative c-di-GMP-specific phosphodiesterase class I)